MFSGEGGERHEGAGGIAGMPGPGCALRSSVLKAPVNMAGSLGRFGRPFVAYSTRYPLYGCNDPGVLLDTVAV